MNYIAKFSEIGMHDVPEVGGKNASLGEMVNHLGAKGIAVPGGFAVTATAFRHFIDCNKLDGAHARLLKKLDRKTFSNLAAIGAEARELINHVRMPGDLVDAILSAYDEVFGTQNVRVAVRSSATAEDLPEASFAGQHESYLNITRDGLADAVKHCFASLYTDRAIKYREDKGFDHAKVFLSVGIQQMVYSYNGCSGVGFTLEPESGFRGVVHLAGVWGLGETIVQGAVSPDEWLIFKEGLLKGKQAVIRRKLGEKQQYMVYGDDADAPTVSEDTPQELRDRFVLADDEICRLARWAMIIEDHYQKPMDFEWAKDGDTGKLWILQARPETVHSRERAPVITEFKLKTKARPVVEGQSIGSRIAAGRARVLLSPADADKLEPGDVLVTDRTSPDWDPILKRVSGIVTNKGGRTSHAAIIARELGVPAVVGTGAATALIGDGDGVTIDCSAGDTGAVYKGQLKWDEHVVQLEDIRLPGKPRLGFILGEPEKAFQFARYPNDGVGLLRLEFIISHYIQAHPMAIVRFDSLADNGTKTAIRQRAKGYPDVRAFFVDKLAQGVATIAAAFYPNPVIVRLSDFKTNEYANLPGGGAFEPQEENPMLGFRGAARYYSDLYKDGFRLECEAMKHVREDLGLENVKLMIPFCRTPEEGKNVLALMADLGLRQGENGLEVYVMAEIPSNILQADEFAQLFDGFSIGSNDLTQLTLGVDRDSELVAGLFNENNPSVRKLITMLIDAAHLRGKSVGICGQGPGDSPAFARFLVELDIDSMSFNPDSFIRSVAVVNEELKAACQPS